MWVSFPFFWAEPDCTTCILPALNNNVCAEFGANPPDNSAAFYGITDDCQEKCGGDIYVACFSLTTTGKIIKKTKTKDEIVLHISRHKMLFFQLKVEYFCAYIVL